MLDPLTGVSLLANIIQVVDFSAQTISLCKQIHKDGQGRPELVEAAADFSVANERLQDTLKPITQPSVLDAQDQVLYDLSTKACKTAGELATELERLHVCDGKGRMMHSVQLALKTLWGKSRVEKLRTQMEDYRRALDSSILVDLR